MNKHLKKTRSISAFAFSVILLQACSGGGSGDAGGSAGNVNVTETPEVVRGVGGSFLFVSVPDFYFGTKDVGTSATQEIELANRGGDVYPISHLTIKGENADEFQTDFVDEIVLNPAEAVNISVTFEPLTDGRKFAELDIDFDSIVQATEEENLNELRFYNAQELESKQRYDQSLQQYEQYIEAGPVTTNERKAIIKAPVLSEGKLYGQGQDFDLYINALNYRESGDYALANAELATIEILHSDSYIADDALYLKAYIELMDKKDYSAAASSMKELRNRYPDSNYYDTALYSEAIAHQELGNNKIAKSIFEDLRYRHTGVDLLGVVMSKDNVISRMWFKRANDALAELGQTV